MLLPLPTTVNQVHHGGDREDQRHIMEKDGSLHRAQAQQTA